MSSIHWTSVFGCIVIFIGGMMKILDVMWFCAGHGNCGIVKVDDPYEGIKYYIGSFPGEEKGHNEQEDKQWIADWGSSFPKEVGHILFGADPIRTGTAVPIPVSKEHAEAMVKVGMFYLESNNGECKEG